MPARWTPALPLVLAALTVAAQGGGCADDGETNGTPAPDTGVDASDSGCPEGSAGCGDAGGPVCTNGFDLDNDGICDRERADWSEGAVVTGDRRDIYLLGEDRLDVAARGLEHTLRWPIDVSGALLPWQPMFRLFDPNTTDEGTIGAQNIARNALEFGNLDEMYDWLGLARATSNREAMPGVPWPEWVEDGTPLGAGTIDTQWGEALTFSCATCHTSNLFGRPVVGLTNRTARANEFFHLAAGFFPDVTPEFFESLTGANATELELFVRTQRNLGAIGSVVPQVLGLDTSLAQVSLSLARREEDALASYNLELQQNPRPNALETFVADSKPAVWWTLKYKNRWLSDGSIVSGNPIFTNFLWNEIGRGTDLAELETWLEENRAIADELTVLAFSTEAPRWTDFLGEDAIDVDAAMRGQATFDTMCASCHGTYEKAWETDPQGLLPLAERIVTTRVTYHEQTPVLDVGTDLQRAQGMEAFADRLNALAISQWMETVVEVQNGYVPPPLDGIWTRYPYLHNGSVPTLCDLLRPASERTPLFWTGPSDNAETDFDPTCVGYPLGDAVPAAWRENPRAEFDTTRPGLSNRGHDAWLTNEDGTPALSDEQRADLIAFLRTL